MTSLNSHVLVNEVNDHVICRLCNGYLTDATTLTTCLHSFCRSCIRRYLATKGHCPQCVSSDGTSVVKPKLRRDRTLQRLVYKMVPGLLQSELRRRQSFAAAREHVKLMTSSTEWNTAGNKWLNGMELSSYQVFTNQETYNVRLDLFKRSETNCDNQEVDEDEIAAESLSSRYLLCPASFTVQLLKKFVRLKLDLNPATIVDLTMNTEILCDSYTLTDLAYIFKHSNDEPITMQYILTKTVMTSSKRDNAAVLQPSTGQKTGVEIAERLSRTPAGDVTSNVVMVMSNNAETSRADCQPGGDVVPKKRGRKPKLHRYPRPLSAQKVQQSLPVQVPSTPVPVGSSDNTEPPVVKRKRGRPRKYNIEPQMPPPVEEPEVNSQQTGREVVSENCVDDVSEIKDCAPTSITSFTDQQDIVENSASSVNNIIETGQHPICGNVVSTMGTTSDVSDHVPSSVVEHQILSAGDRVDNVSDVIDHVSTMASEYQTMSENCVCSVSDDVDHVTTNVNENCERHVDDVTDHEPTTADAALMAENRRGRKRKSTTNGDADEDETSEKSSEDGVQMPWKVASPEVRQDDVLPQIKMTSVRLSRDKSAAAKWLVRPARDSRQGRKRPAASSGGRKQSSEGHLDHGQGRGVQGHGSGRPDIHLMQNANNWIPSSLCSAVASWNAALASVQMRTSNESIGGSHVTPMTSQQHATAFNGMTRLPDFSSMFNYTNMSPSGVTINDVGSEVMFVVGTDRRLSAVPMKIGEMMQFDQSNGVGVGDTGLLFQQSRTLDAGVAGTGRVATVRPLEHAKLASQILTQRAQSSGEGAVVLDHHGGQSVVLVSTMPSACVLAESLTKDHQPLTGVQTSTMSSTTVQVASHATTEDFVTSPDQRADDCFEITSTVADEACVMLPQSPSSRELRQHGSDAGTVKTVCSEEQCATVSAVEKEDQLSNDESSPAIATTVETMTTSSTSPLVQSNSLSGSLNRQKPKKSLETVINLLKRPVSSEVSSLSLAVVDRVLSSLSSVGLDTSGVNRSRSFQNGGHDVTVSSNSKSSPRANHAGMTSPIQSQRRSSLQSPMTSAAINPNDVRLPSSRNNLVVPPGGDFSPSIKRLKNMCNNMAPQLATTMQWQTDVRATGPRPQWASFYQPTLNGSWPTAGERFRHDTSHYDRKQQPQSRPKSPLMVARNMVENHTRTGTTGTSTGYQLNASHHHQQQLNNGGWRL